MGPHHKDFCSTAVDDEADDDDLAVCGATKQKLRERERERERECTK